MSSAMRISHEKQRQKSLPTITLDELIRDLFGVPVSPQPKNAREKTKSKRDEAKRESRNVSRQ